MAKKCRSLGISVSDADWSPKGAVANQLSQEPAGTTE